MKSLILAAFALPCSAIAAPVEMSIPPVSAACQAEARQMALKCPIGKDAAAFLQCKARNKSLATPQCTAELRANMTALAAACRADRAPSQYVHVCASFKAHPKAYAPGN